MIHHAVTLPGATASSQQLSPHFDGVGQQLLTVDARNFAFEVSARSPWAAAILPADASFGMVLSRDNFLPRQLFPMISFAMDFFCSNTPRF